MSGPVDRARVRELFEAACDKPASERAAFLAQAAGDDAALRAEVESLLRFDTAQTDLLSEDRLGREHLADTLGDETDQSVPEFIGTYRVIRLIGSGGMGSVYEAEQAAPQRRVALKVMRSGPQSRQLARRFAREGQIQARLSHPGIAAVYETGAATVHGAPTPYFAMELVAGVPLVAYANSNKLSVRDRLAIMADVCDAVHFAHQHGVIHRDLKPDNVLVTDSDSGPTPKILDFGVAKLTDHDLQATTMRTEAGQIIGTLAYMSPEQLRGRSEEVDTRSDIYGLGVMLFQLLAGRSCYATENLPLAEAVRMISEEEPTSLGSLEPGLRGDVETIVHKSIDRDKLRRYASASELAADIRRFLNNEPITARPSTVFYQFSKFARRNRAVVTAGVLGILALIAGIIGTSLQARAAIKARDAASRQADIASSVTDSLRQVFFLASPDMAQGKDPTLREAINHLADNIKDEYDGPPEAEAIVRNVVGIVQRNLGDYPKAHAEFERALGIRRRVLPPDSVEIAESLHNLGLTKSMSGHAEESLPLMQEALDIQRKALGDASSQVMRSMFNLARAYSRVGRNEEALKLTTESLALHRAAAPNNKEVLAMHEGQLATIHRRMKHIPEAIQHAEESVAMMREAVGADHPALVTSLLELASCRMEAGDPERALPPAKEADEVARRAFAKQPDHPTAKLSREMHAKVLRALGRDAEADAIVPAAPAAPK